MNRKILFVIGGLKRGGAERVTVVLAKQFHHAGWDVSITTLLLNDVDYELNEGIHVIDLTTDRTSRIASIPKWLLGIRKTVKEIRPDVIISFVARINILTQIACKGIIENIIVSERNDPSCDGRGCLIDIATKILYPRAQIVVFQTKRAQKYFNTKIQKNSVIIPNPISVDVQAKIVDSKKIVSVGRLAKQKNHKLLINAFFRVLQNYPEYKLWIYGDGELGPVLSEQVIKLGIEDKVFFPGNVLDIHAQISDAEMFVLSSDYEGLSNALLEAMMMGLPCISTNCAGSDEVIQDEANGLLVPVGDETALYMAMDRLITNRKLRYTIAQNAKKEAEKFKTENIFHKWLEIVD